MDPHLAPTLCLCCHRCCLTHRRRWWFRCWRLEPRGEGAVSQTGTRAHAQAGTGRALCHLGDHFLRLACCRRHKRRHHHHKGGLSACSCHEWGTPYIEPKLMQLERLQGCGQYYSGCRRRQVSEQSGGTHSGRSCSRGAGWSARMADRSGTGSANYCTMSCVRA